MSPEEREQRVKELQADMTDRLNDYLEEWMLGEEPFNLDTVMRMKVTLKEMVADVYKVPVEWVNLVNLRREDNSIVCDGFVIVPDWLNLPALDG